MMPPKGITQSFFSGSTTGVPLQHLHPETDGLLTVSVGGRDWVSFIVVPTGPWAGQGRVETLTNVKATGLTSCHHLSSSSLGIRALAHSQLFALKGRA